MTDFGDVLSAFLSDMIGQRPADMGVEFNLHKAEDAFAIVRSFADEVRQMPETNYGSEFFPRIKVRDHADLDLLRVLLANHAAELKDTLLTSAGRFALGSESVDLDDLRNIGTEYLQAARLINALNAEHKAMVEQERQNEEANRRANEAFREMAERNAHPVQAGRDVYTPQELQNIARNTPEVMEAIAAERKIVAIKALRMAASCTLKAAKEAVEAVS